MDDMLFGSEDEDKVSDIESPQQIVSPTDTSVSPSHVIPSPFNEKLNSPYITPANILTPNKPRTLPFKPHPNPNSFLLLAKLPSTLTVASEPSTEFDTNNPDSPQMIQWKVKYDEFGDPIIENDKTTMTGNSHLVEWNDGSFSLFVGNNIFDCELQNDVIHLFESSMEELRPLHCVVDKNLQIRQSNILQKGIKSYFPSKKNQQRTQLVTFNQAESMQMMTQKVLENKRDADRIKKKQLNASKETGLTGSYLESDSDDDY